MKNSAIVFFAALGLFVVNGCATRQSITLDADAFRQHIAAIHVMPIIDGRRDKSATLDETDFKNLKEKTKNILEQHGYQTALVDSWGTGTAISAQSLSDMSAVELSGLAPADSSIIMVITINDLHDKWNVITAAYSITGTAMAIDRGRKVEIWKDTATGDKSGTGILDAAAAQITKAHSAQNNMLRQVFGSLPNNAK